MYRIVSVGGADAAAFLQGQLTQDVTLLSRQPSLPAAWCNPRGRVIVTVRILALGEHIGLVLPQDDVLQTLERLRVFRLRADVTFEAGGPDWRSFAVAANRDLARLEAAGLLPAAGRNASAAGSGVTVVRLAADEPCVEVFATRDALDAAGLDLDRPLETGAWRQARIRAGLPDIGGDNAERFTPHMLNLDRSGAVSFDKGCYTGQEIVARTEHLGNTKRRLMGYRSDAQAIAPGDKLRHGDRDAGVVVNVSGDLLLAVTEVALHGQTLTLGGGSAEPLTLPYG